MNGEFIYRVRRASPRRAALNHIIMKNKTSKRRDTPFATTITEKQKADLEKFAAEDGIQRGIFFSTSGKRYSERVSSTSSTNWLFKTKAGKPFVW
jgi:hypothetical protein